MKKKFIRKTICILLMAVLSIHILLLTACGGGEAGGKPSDALGSAAEGTSDSMPSASEGSAQESSHAGDSASGAPASSDTSGSSAPDSSASEQPPADVPEGEIIVADLYGEKPSGFFSERVAAFADANPSFGIQYVHAAKDSERERMLMETVTGSGPDLLYVDSFDLENLAENEVLGEIGLLISQENKDALLPAAVSMGTLGAAGTDGEGLIAVPLTLYARTLLTSRDYWQGESWTVEDVVSILEENPGMEGMFLNISGTETYYFNMYYLIGTNIRNTPFLKDGESNFDCQEFRDLLKTVKERTKPRQIDNGMELTAKLNPLMEGHCLGIDYFINDMKNYCDIFEISGDQINLVGLPNDEGNGHYLYNMGMLAVNRNAMEKKGVRELINDLLSLETQKHQRNQISVRADIPEAQLVYSDYSGSYYWSSESGGFLLPPDVDGAFYLEKYVEFLKGASAANFENDEIFDIVMEEADYYFNSDKELDEVVDTIQRRVALYMSERE